jgi:hypothetical protein
MPNSVRKTGLAIGGKYRVIVQGHLDKSFTTSLAGMNIERSHLPEFGPVTLMIGRLRDQAELSGVLNSLYELHLAVLSVEKVSESQNGV